MFSGADRGSMKSLVCWSNIFTAEKHPYLHYDTIKYCVFNVQ